MSIKYHLGVLWRAIKDTLSFFFDLHDRKDFARSLILPLMLFFLQWQASGFNSSASGVTTPVVNALVASVIIVFVAMLWFASPKLNKELADKISSLENEQNALKALLEPKMEIVFDGGKPFEELQPLDDQMLNKRQGIRRLRRIGIHSLGNKTIKGLSVVLAQSVPGINQTTPIPLHRMYGIGGPVYDLDPGATIYFEFLTTFESTTNRTYLDSFTIEHSVKDVDYFNPLRNHRFRVEVTGSDVPMIYRYFLLRVDDNNVARFGLE
jgi:hypothetical protein